MFYVIRQQASDLVKKKNMDVVRLLGRPVGKHGGQKQIRIALQTCDKWKGGSLGPKKGVQHRQ